MKNNFQLWLIKIDRIAAWVLLAAVLMFFVTGYDMENRFLNAQIAHWLHVKLLPAVGMAAFLLHTGPAVRMAFLRWRIWNKVSRAALVLIYAILAAGFIYAAYLYKPASKLNSNTLKNQTQNTPADTADQKIFSRQDLAKYNGKNGAPAYIAVDGIVYDVTGLFINGNHYGCSAGQDVSTEFRQEHAESILKNYPVVGSFK